MPLSFSLEASVSSRGEGIGIEDPSCLSCRFFNNGKLDGEDIRVSSSGEVRPVIEATGESREKEFWVVILRETIGVKNDAFLCFFGIFKH